MELPISRGSKKPAAITIVIFASVAFWLLFVFREMSPLVIYDEYAYFIGGIYLKDPNIIRMNAPHVPQFGNFLFLRLIHAFFSAGFSIERAMKIFNVLALVAAALMLLMSCDGVQSRIMRIVLAALCLWSPYFVFANYVMPEALYFFVFVILFCYFLRCKNLTSPSCCAVVGFIIAILTLVKPHGIFFFLSYILALFVWNFFVLKMSFRAILTACASATLIYAASVFTLNSLLRGSFAARSGNVIGEFYLLMVRGAINSNGMIQKAASSLVGYVSAVIFLIGPSIYVLFCYVSCLRRDRSLDASKRGDGFAALLCLILIVEVLVVCSIVLVLESDRIYLRYISFVFPVVLILAARIHGKLVPISSFEMLVISVLYGAASISLYLKMADTRLLPVDSADLFAFYHTIEFGRFGLGVENYKIVFISIFCASLVALWYFRNILYMQLVISICILPISIFNTVSFQSNFSSRFTAFRDAGKAVEQLCAAGPRGVLAVGSGDKEIVLYYALFQIPRIVPVLEFDSRQIDHIISELGAGACILSGSDVHSHGLDLLMTFPGGGGLYRKTSVSY